MRRIHHINLVVDALEPVVDAMTAVTGVTPLPEERIDARGVVLRRFDLGGTWLILVAPTRPDSPAARRLEAHGPGLFLLSFEVASLQDTLRALEARDVVAEGPIRDGLDDWRVVDLAAGAIGGLPLQLTEPGAGTGATS